MTVPFHVFSSLVFASKELVYEFIKRGDLKINGYFKILDDGSIEFQLSDEYYVLRPYISLIQYLLRIYNEELHRKCIPGRFTFVHESYTIEWLTLMPVKIFYTPKHKVIMEFNIINPFIEKPGDVYIRVKEFKHIFVPPTGFVIATLDVNIEVNKDLALVITFPTEFRWTGLQMFEIISNFRGKPQVAIYNPTVLVYAIPVGTKVRGYVIPKVSSIEELKKFQEHVNTNVKVTEFSKSEVVSPDTIWDADKHVLHRKPRVIEWAEDMCY